MHSLGVTVSSNGIGKGKAKELGYEVLPGDAWIEHDVDVLIPAALENQITAESVKRLSERVRIIAEGANGPTSPDADAVISKRRIFMIPDLLANAGGVTCSYFEQVQCNTNYFWEKDEVLGNLHSKTSDEMVSLLRSLNTDKGLTIIMVTHEESIARAVSNRILTLHDGRIVDEDVVRSVV